MCVIIFIIIIIMESVVAPLPWYRVALASELPLQFWEELDTLCADVSIRNDNLKAILEFLFHLTPSARRRAHLEPSEEGSCSLSWPRIGVSCDFSMPVISLLASDLSTLPIRSSTILSFDRVETAARVANAEVMSRQGARGLGPSF